VLLARVRARKALLSLGEVLAGQVAERAGHSVAVLLKVYAKCLEGQDQAVRRRIEDALGDPGEPERRVYHARSRTRVARELSDWE
jgi:hypothetical protein